MRDKRTNGRTGSWKGGVAGRRTDRDPGRTDGLPPRGGQTVGQTDIKAGRRTIGRMERGTGRRTDSWTEGRTKGTPWMD